MISSIARSYKFDLKLLNASTGSLNASIVNPALPRASRKTSEKNILFGK
jgi:hypothetical protein